MKIFIYLNIETAVKGPNGQILECYKASFLNRYVSNALPAVGNEFSFHGDLEINRCFKRLDLPSPRVTSVRQVVRGNVLDHEVVYTQRVELSNEEAKTKIGHTVDLIPEGEERMRSVAEFEVAFFHDSIKPWLLKLGFLYNHTGKDTWFPKHQ